MAKKTVICWECSKKFKHEEGCEMHAKCKGHIWRPPAPNVPSPNAGFTCNICNKAFKAKGALAMHVKDKHTCEPCMEVEASTEEHLLTAAPNDGSEIVKETRAFHDNAQEAEPEATQLEMSITAITSLEHSFNKATVASPVALPDLSSRAVLAEVGANDAALDADENLYTETRSDSFRLTSQDDQWPSTHIEDIDDVFEGGDAASVVSYASFAEVSVKSISTTSLNRSLPNTTTNSQEGMFEQSDTCPTPRQRILQLASTLGPEMVQRVQLAIYPLSGIQDGRPPSDDGFAQIESLDSQGQHEQSRRSTEQPTEMRAQECVELSGPREQQTIDVARSETEASRSPPSGINLSEKPLGSRNVSIYWHCRSCQRDPCESPVATMCGHVFCRSCILQEMQDNGCCPECKRIFLLCLDVYA